MHIASANGHLEIVKELLQVDRRLSQVKGRDQCTALHYAARRGRIEIIKEMVSACSECVEDVTEQGETVFHLAVKNNQFEAIDAMVELVVQCLLANKGTSTPGTLDVNSVNQSGLTALDLLLIFPSGAGDLEIDGILSGAGALRARDIAHTNHNLTVLSVPAASESHDIVCSWTQKVWWSTSSSKGSETLLMTHEPLC
ncbi:putative ankyrin repeat-containing domain-containing protein [Rosa chinensis]|uniref:Putative ankyrin repeat-containing domain-containing protein n=1 Tax=Rosa chinensis TaxID=74649 RepID=A0A2P6SM25_ROSCH|nr:putative ankyrin repeat-containing domain-containing protein [Rosa chinensis]